MSTVVSNKRKRTNSRDHSPDASHASPEEENESATKRATMAKSPPNNVKKVRPPPPLYTALGLTGWEHEPIRIRYKTIFASAFQHVINGGYDKTKSWTNHTLAQRAKALLDFQEYIKKATG
jgi:hypothetical protein